MDICLSGLLLGRTGACNSAGMNLQYGVARNMNLANGVMMVPGGPAAFGAFTAAAISPKATARFAAPRACAGTAAMMILDSPAGIGWVGEAVKINAAARLTHADVAGLRAEQAITAGNGSFFTKPAVMASTFVTRRTRRDRGIRMIAVSPGPVDTPILKGFSKSSGSGPRGP